MLTSVNEVDNLAFVLAHESAHCIRGYIQQKQRNALTGAEILLGLSGLAGAQVETVKRVQASWADAGIPNVLNSSLERPVLL